MMIIILVHMKITDRQRQDWTRAQLKTYHIKFHFFSQWFESEGYFFRECFYRKDWKPHEIRNAVPYLK